MLDRTPSSLHAHQSIETASLPHVKQQLILYGLVTSLQHTAVAAHLDADGDQHKDHLTCLKVDSIIKTVYTAAHACKYQLIHTDAFKLDKEAKR